MSTTTAPQEVPQPRKMWRVNWPLFWKRCLYWIWTLTTKAAIFLVTVELMSAAIVHLFPDMGKKLWKIPFLASLNDYELTHRLTLANVFVCIPIFCTFMLWSLIFKLHLAPERFKESYNRFDGDRLKRVILIIGIIVVLADAGLFFTAFGMSSWGKASYGPTTFLATGLYVAVIAFSSLISVYLSDDVVVHKQPTKEKES